MMNPMAIFCSITLMVIAASPSSPAATPPSPQIIAPSQYQIHDREVEALHRRLEKENPQRFAARTFNHADHTVRYRWFAPAKTDRPLPLVITLHGSSGKGNDDLTQLTGGNAPLSAGVWAAPEFQKKYPCFVLAPQCPPGEMWTHTTSWTSPTHLLSARPAPALAGVMALLDELIKTQRIDPTRIYLVGASMGGYGTWDWIVRESQRFAAAIPACGGMPEGQAARLKDLPLWIFHGENDTIVPVAESRRAFSEIIAAGGSPRYTEYAQGPHRISIYVWHDPETARWLFSQSLKSATPAH
jgi:predicted peptidase